MTETTKNYLIIFGELPSLIYGLTYEDPIYQKLMRGAIKSGKPLSVFDINEAFVGVETDFIVKKFDTKEEMEHYIAQQGE